jgi:hypothetical protein
MFGGGRAKREQVPHGTIRIMSGPQLGLVVPPTLLALADSVIE